MFESFVRIKADVDWRERGRRFYNGAASACRTNVAPIS